MIFAFIILGTALLLSMVAAYYSIAGLTAIFAAAVLPVVIMGATLELGKVVATVWLHNNWKRVNIIFKLYLVPAVVFLMILTSMGIFGFLSKAHSDQSLVTGDAMSKVAIYDEKIATEKGNIDANKKALTQMDAQVDQMLGRSDTERGAERAVQIRKQQQKERAALQAEINKSQKEIQKLQEERAPLAAEFRKVEAEVGPIKYIAAFIYGDNPDQNILERAVRWVIILIVVVFDPLALCLILAGNKQVEWAREERVRQRLLAEDENIMAIVPPNEADTRPFTEEEVKALDGELPIQEDDEKLRAELANEEIAQIEKPEETIEIVGEPKLEEPEQQPVEVETVAATEPVVEIVDQPIKEDGSPNFEGVKDPETGEWIQTGPSFIDPKKKPYRKGAGDYVEYEGKNMHIDVLRSMNPSLFLEEDQQRASRTNFGTDFPSDSKTGDTFVRVDATPNRVFKFNGMRWIQLNRGVSESYLTDQYLQFLVDKIATGEYDLDMLTDNEQDAVEKFVKKQSG